MSKKNKDDGQWTMDDEEPVVSEPVVEEPKKYFDLVNWKNVRTVYQCTTCGACRDERDAMILHVLLHIPPAQQNQVFETLMKEK